MQGAVYVTRPIYFVRGLRAGTIAAVVQPPKGRVGSPERTAVSVSLGGWYLELAHMVGIYGADVELMMFDRNYGLWPSSQNPSLTRPRIVSGFPSPSPMLHMTPFPHENQYHRVY